MQKTYAILKALNELLENKENYNPADYKKALQDLMKEIDQQLLSANYKKATKKGAGTYSEAVQSIVKNGVVRR